MVNTLHTYSDKSSLAAQNRDMDRNCHNAGSFVVLAAQKRIVGYLLWFYEHVFWLKLPYE